MDFSHRKLLILDKINSYKNNTSDEEKNKFDDCDECKDALNDYYLQTPFPPPPPPPSHHSSSILVLMLCILGFAFVLVSYFSIVRYRSRSLRRSNSLATTSNRVSEEFMDENHGPVVDHPIWYIRTIGLQQSVIDSILVFKYKKDEKLVEGSDCSVCLSEFEEGENLRLLPKCSHAFHIHCIDTWLRSHQNCPLCRASVVGEVNLNGGLGSVEEGEAEAEAERVETRDEVENQEGEEENMSSEMRVRAENVILLNDDRRSRKDKVRVRSDFVEHNARLDEEIEKVRRSISLNTYSASMAYLNIVVADKFPVDGEGSSSSKDEGCSNVQTTEKMKQSSEIISKTGSRNPSIYKLMKSSSLGRSLQKMPISMKRSFSTAGKSSLSTHSRSQSSTEHS